MTPTEVTEQLAAAFKEILEEAANNLPVSDTNKLSAYMADMSLKAFFVTAKRLGMEARANTNTDAAYGEMMAALHGFIEAKLTETLRTVVPGVTVHIELERPNPTPIKGNKPKLSLVPSHPEVPEPSTPPKPAS